MLDGLLLAQVIPHHPVQGHYDISVFDSFISSGLSGCEIGGAQRSRTLRLVELTQVIIRIIFQELYFVYNLTRVSNSMRG